MNAEYSHLSPAAAAVLSRPVEERIEFLRRDHFIQYAAADKALAELQDLLAYPKSLRMPCRALIGQSQNGKTTLQREFLRRNPTMLDAAQYPVVPVIWFDTPTGADEGRFLSSLLTAMTVPHRPDAAPEKLEPQVLSCLAERRTRAIVADEFHNMLHASPAGQRSFMAVIKRFVNTTQIPLIASGTSDVLRALATDSQFVSRFLKLSLPTWGPDRAFLELLVGFERTLPLAKPSQLHSAAFADLIYKRSRKVIGSVKDIVQEAAVRSLRAGNERITYELLQDTVKDLETRSLALAG